MQRYNNKTNVKRKTDKKVITHQYFVEMRENTHFIECFQCFPELFNLYATLFLVLSKVLLCSF